MDSPVGTLRIVASDAPSAAGSSAAITAVDFLGSRSPAPTDAASVARATARADSRPLGDRRADDPLLAEAVAQLTAYFARERKEFDLPLAPAGTDFQHKVWDQLRDIGYSETATYGELAARLGMTGHAARAVGLANGRNPIPIVIPCHRVVGSDGSLTGYGGGIERKQILLRLEQAALF
jgi:methylated-DNA-[protein]-cysteine S-methyltransferase